MRTLLLFLIFLVVLTIGCFVIGTGKILLVAGTLIFILAGLPIVLIGLAKNTVLPTCLGIGAVSLGIGCFVWLQYLCGG